MAVNIAREEAERLIEAAREVRARSYSPYSGFAVGAALLDSDGRVHTGTNVENASYGLTTCAERSAVSRAVAEGSRGFVAVAIVGPSGEPTMPCGSCRQILFEFAPDIEVIVEGSEAPDGRPLRDLLPDAFGPLDLDSPRDGSAE